ncbi:MAG: hypothetical protein Q4P15_02000 [Propionibacteriaceae bacterium]|nr:hypothetical protein [Propionibacteriaceae bacterium]
MDAIDGVVLEAIAAVEGDKDGAWRAACRAVDVALEVDEVQTNAPPRVLEVHTFQLHLLESVTPHMSLSAAKATIKKLLGTDPE